jgi:hypothetical protein
MGNNIKVIKQRDFVATFLRPPIYFLALDMNAEVIPEKRSRTSFFCNPETFIEI